MSDASFADLRRGPRQVQVEQVRRRDLEQLGESSTFAPHTCSRPQRGKADCLSRFQNSSHQVVNHLATFDFGNADRQGDRAVVVGETPYFDPASIGRR